jgi:Mrp family chromosome partitioning ATPase
MLFRKKTAETGISREMHSLIQRLSLTEADEPVKIVAFIAARPGEGTTTVAKDYATALAGETGQKVLLIDAASPLPPRQKKIGGDSSLGIVDCAAAGGAPGEIAQSLAPGVSTARWIGRAENAAAGGRLARDPAIWQTLLENFDTLVIDAPALQRSYDGVVLAACADAAAMVVEAEATRQPVIENLRDTLLGAGVKLAGIVMNKRRFYIPRRVYKRL